MPFGQYVVFGSGPLAAHGIWLTSDVDLFFTTTLYEKLKAMPGKKGSRTHRRAYSICPGESTKLDYTWEYGVYNPTPEALIATADVIDVFRLLIQQYLRAQR